jgi:hypothetical protein
MIDKEIRNIPLIVKLLITVMIMSGILIIGSGINPLETSTLSEEIQSIVVNPILLPYSMLVNLLTPETYAQWRLNASFMDDINIYSKYTLFLSFLSIYVWLIKEVLRIKDYEALGILCGFVSTIGSVYLHADLYSVLPDNPVIYFVWLIMSIPVIFVGFGLPSVILFKIGLIDKSFIEAGMKNAKILIFPSSKSGIKP